MEVYCFTFDRNKDFLSSLASQSFVKLRKFQVLWIIVSIQINHSYLDKIEKT